MSIVRFKYFELTRSYIKNRKYTTEPFDSVHDLLQQISNEKEPSISNEKKLTCTILTTVKKESENITIGRFSTAKGGTPLDLIHIKTRQRSKNSRQYFQGEEKRIYFAVHTSTDQSLNDLTTLILQDNQLDNFNEHKFTSFLKTFDRKLNKDSSPCYSYHANEMQGEAFFEQLEQLSRIISMKVTYKRSVVAGTTIEYFLGTPNTQAQDTITVESRAKKGKTLMDLAIKVGNKKFKLNDPNIVSISLKGVDEEGRDYPINTIKLFRHRTISIDTEANGSTLLDESSVFKTLKSLASDLP